MLLEQSRAGAGMEAHLPIIGLIDPGQKSQQRRFSHAIGTDQPDPFPGLEFKTDVAEQGAFVEAAAQRRATEEQHCHIV